MKALLLAALAFAAAPPDEKKALWKGPPDVVTPMPLQWLKVYPLTPYKAHWSFEIEVKDFDRTIAALQKLGLRPTQPLELFPAAKTQRQVSFKGSFKQAESAEKRLRKLGKVLDLRRRAVTEPVSLAEVNEKIAKLSAERAASPDALAKMPSVSAAVDELLGHLLSVKALQERTDSEVLLNLTLRLKP